MKKRYNNCDREKNRVCFNEHTLHLIYVTAVKTVGLLGLVLLFKVLLNDKVIERVRVKVKSKI